LDRLQFKLFAALIVGLLSTHTAGAQTAANITVVSGNGQIVCATCTNSLARSFQTLIVKVTDGSGQPIQGKNVNWTLVSSQGPPPFFADSTTTDANGIATNFFTQASQPGSFAQQYLQSVVQATADGVTVKFTETQGLSDINNHQLQFINARLDSPAIGVPLQGTAGGSSSTQVRVHVDAFGIPIQNASVRILSGLDPTKNPSAACATGAGADVGSVLTDANGDGVCTIVFGPISGIGNFTVLVGGIDPAVAPDYYPGLSPIAYWQSGIVPINIQAGVAGMVAVSAGNNQNINPGQQASPLVVKVTDAAGVNPIPGATVVWSVTPAGAATLNPTTSTTNSQGLASTTPTLAANAVGAISIKAALTGSQSNLSTTFTLTANVTLSGLQKVSGDGQSGPAGQAFGQPLVVQVNGSNGQPAANVPVTFSITGPGSLSATSATTNSAGRAQVTVTAGATQGNVTVTAQVGGFSQAFGLTVIPPGPSLTANSFVNGADFQRGSISPCSVATIIAQGVAPNVQGVVTSGNIVGPLPYLLATVKVTFNNSQAPIYNVANVNGQQQVTVQVPCDITPGNSVPVTVNVGGGNASINVPVLPAAPGAFLTTMSDGQQRVVAVRPDGSFVSIENPARRGEIIRAYTTGLGPVTPAVSTNSIPVPGTDSNVVGQVIVGVNNAGTRLVSARLAPSLIGVYEIAFEVPSDAPAGNNVVFSVGVNSPGDTQTRFSAGTTIPIL
jgi:uncharacterized protein (TIGR03437 family)